MICDDMMFFTDHMVANAMRNDVDFILHMPHEGLRQTQYAAGKTVTFYINIKCKHTLLWTTLMEALRAHVSQYVTNVKTLIREVSHHYQVMFGNSYGVLGRLRNESAAVATFATTVAAFHTFTKAVSDGYNIQGLKIVMQKSAILNTKYNRIVRTCVCVCV